MNKIKPMIYVACLAAYNSGFLHGEWIDAAQEPEEITQQVQEMLEKSPVPNAEEWAIHDYMDFGGVSIEEYSSFCYVSAVAKMLTANHDFTPDEIGTLWALRDRENPEEMIDFINDNYQGHFDSLGAWAENITMETGDFDRVPVNLRSYIDFDAIGRDSELNGDIYAIPAEKGGLHIFWNN